MGTLSLFEQFEIVGRDLFVSRLISSHGGNLSVRRGDDILITRTGSQLGHLTYEDIVKVSASAPTYHDEHASCELVVHRAIYQAREEKWGETEGAIVHAHAQASTIRSMFDDVIEPLDSEARLVIPKVKVVTSKTTIGSSDAGVLLAEALSADEDPNEITVLRGHGPFAHGSTLEDAYRLVSILEHSSEIINVVKTLGKGYKDYLD